MTRIQIYREFAKRADGQFPCSWRRVDDPVGFDRIHGELDSMDAEGLLGCLFKFEDSLLTAQLSPAGIDEMQAYVLTGPQPGSGGK